MKYVTTQIKRERHRVVGETEDPRVVITECGKRIALGAIGPIRDKTDCPECKREHGQED